MITNVKEIKILNLTILECMKNSKTTVNNSEAIIKKMNENKFGIYSSGFIDVVYDVKINAYIFNTVVLPKYNLLDLSFLFVDTLLFNTLLNDNYSKDIISKIEPFMPEGPYGYLDGDFKVFVEPNDIVIDAGAYIGDFSAYAASKGATCYAFEPVSEAYEILKNTNEMNTHKFIPVKYGLGDTVCNIPISINGSSSSILSNKVVGKTEIIKITTLDEFVVRNNIDRIDFIKADIEGAERDMLIGAKNVLKKFAPKLAICTYHLPDDPEVLKKIILEANPKYRIVLLWKKLYACI
jgi:FkbM family methyltransferase